LNFSWGQISVDLEPGSTHLVSTNKLEVHEDHMCLMKIDDDPLED